MLKNFAKKAKKVLQDGMETLRGRGRGGKSSSSAEPRPRRLRVDNNPVVQFFNKITVFNKIFHDPELEYIDPFATIMFFISAVMLVMCVPYSLLRCPQCAGIRQRYGRLGTWFLRALDCILRACAVFASLFYFWIPVNKIVHAYLRLTQKSKNPLQEYMADPDNFETVVTNDPTPMILASFIIAGLSMSGALMLFVRFIQKSVADDPDQLKREMDEIRKKQVESVRKGSGDMPPKDKDREERTITRRKTPLRSCRLRNSFGRDSAKE